MSAHIGCNCLPPTTTKTKTTKASAARMSQKRCEHCGVGPRTLGLPACHFTTTFEGSTRHHPTQRGGLKMPQVVRFPTMETTTILRQTATLLVWTRCKVVPSWPPFVALIVLVTCLCMVCCGSGNTSDANDGECLESGDATVESALENDEDPDEEEEASIDG